MLKLLRSQQSCLNWFRQADALTHLTLGIALLTSVGDASRGKTSNCSGSGSRSVTVLCFYIYGSPIPTPCR
jgi:hypothetical protein